MSFSLSDFVTIREATERDDVPYSARWIKHLIHTGKVEGTKIGSKRRGQWLVRLPSLLEYVERLQELGTQKHVPYWARPTQEESEKEADG